MSDRELVEAAAEAVARHFDIPAYIGNKSRLKDALSIAAPIIAADAERRVRSGLAKQMRDDAEANRKLGNVDAAGIFDDIAKDLEADHAG